MSLEHRIGQTTKPADAAEDARKNQLFLRLAVVGLARDDVESDAARRRCDLAGVVRHAESDANPLRHSLEEDCAARA